MSLNKFMHPRNRYRKPPDFKALAIKYPEFRKHAKQEISGKVSLNFKDLEAVRALTRTLLLEDFNLDVEIPLDRLIPTLPLRLNYLLWIEDLLENNKRTSDVKGIDIGCGASCVYPLLAAKQFGWRILATEVDTESAFIASRNVKKNNLQDLIKVRSVKEGQMLEGVLEPNTTYDFCMCNPPFFSSTEELDPKNVARSPNRPAPRNAHSGTTTELVAPGGETAFVAAIIRDSNRLRSTVRIYSVMVGHKTSVGKVRRELQDAGVPQHHITTSEFCQGRTTRWGVAWTMDPSISFPQPSEASQLKKKKPTPLCHTFQSDLTSTVDRLKALLEQLQITYQICKSTEELCAVEVTAVENTWANTRKKRRQEKLQQKQAANNVTEPGENSEVKSKANGEVNKVDTSGSGGSKPETSCEQEKVVEESGTNNVEESDSGQVAKESGVSKATAEEFDSEVTENRKKRCLPEGDEFECSSDSNLSKKPKLEDTTNSNVKEPSKKEPILHGSMLMKKSTEGCCVELTWLRGSGGKDSAHQVLQYLKNNFEPH